MIASIIAGITGVVGKAIDKAFPDANEREAVRAKVLAGIHQLSSEELSSATNIIMAEAQGESWLQRNWRPLLMLWFAGLVGAHWVGMTPPNLPEPVVLKLLGIVQVGIGGYVVGRSAEKTVKAWRASKAS